MRRLLLIFLLGACEHAVLVPDGGVDAGPVDAGPADAGPRPDGGCRLEDGGVPALGLNDVSILLPLEASLVPVSELVPRALYDRVVANPEPLGSPTFIFDSYDQFQVVAVRLDLCDRAGPGACPALDPRFRLVLQRVNGASANDVALHAFFSVPAAELPAILGALDALARQQALPATSFLQVSPALRAAPAGPYAQGLAALVRRYCSPATLSRLTFFAQPDIFAQVRWVFRGIELQAGAFADIAIPHATDGGVQHVFLSRNGYDVTMLADVPQGFARVVSESAIAQATPDQVTEALAAIAEIDDPRSRHVDSLQCVTCHVATPLVGFRADAGVVPTRFTSPWSPSIDGGALGAPRAFALRGFGWLDREPLISQRVVNETAEVLEELGACR